MAENDGASSLPAVSTPAPSSLVGDAIAAKAQIETWISQGPTSAYWRGDGNLSGDRIQAMYRDLLRAEEAGAADAIGPPAQSLDADLPISVQHYNVAGADGARGMSAADRDLVDAFLPVAFAAGLGQQAVAKAIGWCLTIPGLTANQFQTLGIAAGFSDQKINVFLSWHRAEAARRGARR